MKSLPKHINSADQHQFLFFGIESAGEATESTEVSAEDVQENNDISAMGSELSDVNLDDADKPSEMSPEEKKAFIDRIGSDLNYAKDWFAENPLAYVDEQGFIHPGDGTTIEDGKVDFPEFRKDCFLVSDKYSRDQYKSIVANLLPSVDKGGYSVRELSTGNALTGGHITEIKAYLDSGDEAQWTPKVEEVINTIMPGKVSLFREAGSNFGTKNINVRMELGRKINIAANSQTQNLVYKEKTTEEYNRIKNQ